MPAAALPPPGAPGVLYLVDLSGYVFRAYHAIAPLSSSKGEPTHAVLGTVNMLQKVVAERRPELFAIAMDSKAPTFRRDLDARYKANRPAPPPDLSQQMERCEAIVRAYNVPTYQTEGIEADDLIAALVKRSRAEGLKVIVVSADKDLMQLVDDQSHDVLLWDSMRDRVFGPDEVRVKFGVPPSQVRDLLALTGDTSDNVPGVPSVGPKTAADLLGEFGTLDGIYAHLPDIKRAKLREALATHEADARLSQKLVTLKDDLEIAWDREHLLYGGADTAKLRELFSELEFGRLLDGLEAPVVTARSQTICAGEAEVTALLREATAKKLVALNLVLVGAAGRTGVAPMQGSLVGLGIAHAAGEGHYVPIGHRYLGAPKQLTEADVLRLLAPVLADESVVKVAYDLKTAEVYLRRKGLEIRGITRDPMIASYLLEAEMPLTLKDLARRTLGVEIRAFGEAPPSGKGGKPRQGSKEEFDSLSVEDAAPYGAGEAEAALHAMEKLDLRLERDGLGALFRDLEMPLSSVLAAMEVAGVLIDPAMLAEVGTRADVVLRDLEARAKASVGIPFSIRSRDQLEKVLFDELKLPVLKRTPKGGRSTDAEVLEELAEKHDLPKLVVEHREVDKLKGTYIDALPRSIDPKTGRIHARFMQAVAATGRISGADPNLQNIPIRTELGREIRSAFVAPPGTVLLSADYSQIELRVLAHLARDPDLVDAFTRASDVHTRTAALVFDVKEDAVTTEMRRRAKTINFGVIYGMGDAALARQLGITKDEANRFIAAYFARYQGVARFMTETVENARKGEAVRTMLGRRRFLPNLHSANRGLRMEAERIAKNTPIQGTAADILKLAMVRLGSDRTLPARMILTVHDELVFEVAEKNVEEAGKRIKEAMESVVTLAVPLVVDVGTGKNWTEAH